MQFFPISYMYSAIRAIHRTILMRTPSPLTCLVFVQGTRDVAAEMALFSCVSRSELPAHNQTRKVRGTGGRIAEQVVYVRASMWKSREANTT
ncbi:hypothetical protein [Ktedonospora formicarum]|uniref:Uncharacterized protein n=1 Tax=Ktedonospora formicarum TaxID=2778364 RepID=A0A8J3I670_9CHLR|nr:hypothetical protein [Ktedonospora formicarum]GHO48136.1 hypothetical protein KSX_62990 [Ktedonospora formicarum]